MQGETTHDDFKNQGKEVNTSHTKTIFEVKNLLVFLEVMVYFF